MIQVKKTRKSKSILTIIITSAVLVLLTIGIVIVTVIANKEKENTVPSAGSSSDLIYPALSNIAGFDIESHENGYFGARLYDGTYYLYYRDENGDISPYYPMICESEPGFGYTSLYAVTDDGMNAQKIAYILYAMRNLAYESKIELTAPSGEAREDQLKVYGLDKDNRSTVKIQYYVDGVDEEGKPAKVVNTKTVHLGKKLVTGTGYYVMLDGSDYPEGDEYNSEREEANKFVYVSAGAENYSAALEGFNSFVKPSLVMGANAANGDTAEIPLLTSSYRQWTNVVRKGQEYVGLQVAKNSRVVFTAKTLSSAFSTDGDSSEEKIKVEEDGYIKTDKKQNIVNLESFASKEFYTNFVKTLEQCKIGDKNIISTVIFDALNGAEENTAYSYTIYEIEAVIDDEGNEYRPGAANASGNILKVRYSCTANGKAEQYEGAGADMLHAVIDLRDLRDNKKIAEDKINALSNIANSFPSLENGKLENPVSFDITYNAENSNPSTYQYIIKHITAIFDGETQTESYVINDKSKVTFSYEERYDGKKVSEGYTIIDLSVEKEDILYKEIRKTIREAKMDEKGFYETNILAYEEKSYFQSFMHFITYEIDSIDYFIEGNEIVSFKYTNPDKVDNFHGGVIHENTLKNSEYSNYSLDMESCERVIRILSGSLPGASTTTFGGLSGSKVVAVGLTPQNMDEYDLYDYTIYYELPRLYDMDNDKAEAYVGFNIYISRDKDGIRYAASDMYDVIVEIDSETFDFLEKTFVDFWASRRMPMFDQQYVEKVTADFNLKGFEGKYTFSATHPDVLWLVTYNDGKAPARLFDEPEDAPNIASKIKYENAILVNVSVSGDSVTETEVVRQLKKYYASAALNGTNYVDINAAYYEKENPRTDTIEYDYLGEAYFRDVLYAIYSTQYAGPLTKYDEIVGEAVLSLSFDVEDSKVKNVYNFYYTKTGHVAVEIVDKNNNDNKSCHFYITNHAFKSIVYAFSDLVNGNTVEINAGYRD